MTWRAPVRYAAKIGISSLPVGWLVECDRVPGAVVAEGGKVGEGRGLRVGIGATVAAVAAVQGLTPVHFSSQP